MERIRSARATGRPPDDAPLAGLDDVARTSAAAAALADNTRATYASQVEPVPELARAGRRRRPSGGADPTKTPLVSDTLSGIAHQHAAVPEAAPRQAAAWTTPPRSICWPRSAGPSAAVGGGRRRRPPRPAAGATPPTGTKRCGDESWTRRPRSRCDRGRAVDPGHRGRGDIGCLRPAG